jgi:hypothetical protein
MGPYVLDFKNPYQAYRMGNRLVGTMTTDAERLRMGPLLTWLRANPWQQGYIDESAQKYYGHLRKILSRYAPVCRNESQQGYKDDRGREAEMGQRSMTHQ